MPQGDPYAEFGGSVATATPPLAQNDPYSAFGGSIAPSQGTPITDSSTIGPGPSLLQRAGRAVSDIADIPTQLPQMVEGWANNPSLNDAPIVANARQLIRTVLPEIETLGGGVSAEEPVAEGVEKLASTAKEALTAAPKTESELASEGNRLLRTTPKSFGPAQDIQPGRAIVKEAVDPKAIESANNARLAKDPVAEEQHMQAIKDHLDKSLQNLKEQQAVLLRHPTGEGIDLRPIVEDSYQKALAEAQKTGSPEIVKAINKAHEEMIKIPNEDGELIANRYLNHTAEDTAEATQEFKQAAQGRANYKTAGGVNDTATQAANKLWKDVAAKVRTHIEDRVPGIGEVNSRLRDANAASKLAEKRILALKGQPALPSRMQRFISAAGPAAAKGAAGGLGAGAAYEVYHKFLSE